MRPLSIAVVLLAACGLDATSPSDGTGTLEGAMLVGDIPGLENLSDQASRVLTANAATSTRVTVVVENARGAGMAQLDVDPRTLDSGRPAVQILACSGPRAFEWSY